MKVYKRGISRKRILNLLNPACILSGLYGLLRPLDLIQPYRLEMGTVYANPSGKDLYSFWGDRLKESIIQDLHKAKIKTIINLASVEYAKAARLKNMDAKVISPIFQDEKNGRFKIISFYAKRARGLMARYLITEGIRKQSELYQFNLGGYVYCQNSSTDECPVFKRSEQARSAA